MKKIDALKHEFEKVELMIASVSELVIAQHFEAAQLTVKRLEMVSEKFKELLLAPEPEAEGCVMTIKRLEVNTDKINEILPVLEEKAPPVQNSEPEPSTV